MALTDTIESIDAAHTTRRCKSGDRTANLDNQPRRIACSHPEATPVPSRITRHFIRRKGTVILGRPIRKAEQSTKE
ncbi:hypothetical protein [Novosphingobium sp.]|uniref:hypothetical protein n=1 Tax=Novosphingobium sp. TaxID=1874826 RepID=UPI003D6D106F